jgi:hypothetical protein
MANEMKSINLLPNKGEGLIGEFLSWSVTIGRLLVILTETVALCTFLYRFNLDMKIVDLHDQIKAESFIVRNFATSEANFRSLQSRLLLIKTVDDAQNVPTIFKDIAAIGQGRITFQSLSVASDSVKIEAQTSSPKALTLFIAALRKYPEITNISVDKIENKTTSATVSVVISGTLKNRPLPAVQLDTNTK